MMKWINTNYLEPENQAKEHTLITYVYQCNNLPPADINGLSDP